MARFIKGNNRSILGLRGNWPLNNYALTHAHDANLNIGAADIAYIFHIPAIKVLPSQQTIYNKEGGVPTRGMTIRYDLNRIAWQARDVLGAQLSYFAPGIVTLNEDHIYHLFCDRDANIYIYDNGVLVSTQDITAVNSNQDNNGIIYIIYNAWTLGVTYKSSGLLNSQFWNFGVGNLPNSLDRMQIVKETMADPYSLNPTLEARPAAATEKRMHLRFLDEDPDNVTVTDHSGYGLSPTIAGGNRVRDCVKEYYNV